MTKIEKIKINYGGIYVGEVKDGKPHGNGKLTHYYGGGEPIDDVHDKMEEVKGVWKNGKLHGQGVWETYRTNPQDIEEIEGGERIIFGQIIKFEGEYKNGEQHKGTANFFHDDSLLIGGIEDDWGFHHRVRFDDIVLDRVEYTGEFDGFWISGYGIMTYTNGSKYVGEWKKDQYHGKGTLTLPDGSKQKGMWDEGHFIEEDENKN